MTRDCTRCGSGAAVVVLNPDWQAAADWLCGPCWMVHLIAEYAHQDEPRDDEPVLVTPIAHDPVVRQTGGTFPCGLLTLTGRRCRQPARQDRVCATHKKRQRAAARRGAA
jgi:hypothetical protein